MTIKKSLLISTLFHLLIILSSVFSQNQFNIKFDIKQGISSLAMKVVNSKKSQDSKKHKKVSRDTKDPKRLVPEVCFYTFTFVKTKKNIKVKEKKKETKEEDTTAKQNNRNSMVSKSVVGALYKRASILSQNQAPEYPYFARKMCYEGKVILNIQVMPSGRTGNINIISSSGYDILDHSALRAAKQWRFFEEGEVYLQKSVLITRGLEFIIKDKVVRN